MKTAFLFPGQGAQIIGMGRELHDHFPAAKRVFERAAAVLGAEYVDVCFHGPEEKLRQTRFTQPALFLVSMAAHAVLEEAGCRADLAAGHSLGEYSALCAAGAFDLDTGFALVKARGEAIQEASDRIPGAMAAIVGLERPKVEEICKSASSNVGGRSPAALPASAVVCEAVNFNCPGQIVIAGAVEAVEEAVKLAQAAGSPKSVRLNVSGPFHSSLMKPAAEKMASVIEKAAIRDSRIPVIANCDAQLTQKAGDIKTKLVRQIDHAVLWEDGMRAAFAAGVDSFVEVGAGRVLGGLLRRIDKTKKFSNVEDKKSADAVLQSPQTDVSGSQLKV